MGIRQEEVHRRARTRGLTALVAVLGILTLPSSASALTVTVTSNADTGEGSLREAITAVEANNNTLVLDKIDFNAAMVGQTITLLSALPALDEPVSINGCSSAPNATGPCVGLRRSVSETDNGLVANAAGTTIRGLAISNFTNGILGTAGSLTVRNCRFGSTLAGANEPNEDGIFLGENADFATIGGPAGVFPINRNVIGQNEVSGIALVGADSASIQGNLIGTDPSGLFHENGSFGVTLQTGATQNTIGGDTATEENVISNSGGPGIHMSGSTTVNNLVDRNTGRDNGGMFIELEPPVGPGSNDVTGANQGVDPPVITTATTESASGTGAGPGSPVRLFRSATNETGRIDAFVAQAEADLSGNWSVAYPPIPPGGFLVATYSTNNNSSELSASVAYINVTPSPIVPLAGENPLCAELRDRLATLNRKIKRAEGKEKDRLKRKRRRVRRNLAELGCA